MIKLKVNGEIRAMEEEISVTGFLHSRGLHPLMVAVELNGRILLREEYTEAMLRDGDTVEIVQMMAGG